MPANSSTNVPALFAFVVFVADDLLRGLGGELLGRSSAHTNHRRLEQPRLGQQARLQVLRDICALRRPLTWTCSASTAGRLIV